MEDALNDQAHGNLKTVRRDYTPASLQEPGTRGRMRTLISYDDHADGGITERAVITDW